MTQKVSAAITQLYNGEATNEETVQKLMDSMSKEELAEFIVDAFNRGWISKWNLGLESAE